MYGVAVAQTRVNTDPGFRRLGRVARPLLARISPTSSLLDWFPQGLLNHLLLLARPVPALTPYFDHKGDLQHRADSRGALRGTVYLINEGGSNDERRRRRSAWRRLAGQVHQHSMTLQHPDGGWFDQLAEEAGALARAKLDFTLYRTGELRLSGDLSPYHGDLSQKVESRLSLVRQIYYYIKDCAHRHHHHDPSDDQLLPITPLMDLGIKEDGHWRRQVLWALTKVAGQFRRDREQVKRRQALGVIAYAEAFQLTLARVRRLPGEQGHEVDDSLATFNFEQQRDSIEVSQEVDSWRRQGLFSTWALVIATVISFSSLWFAAERSGSSRWPRPMDYGFSLPETFYTHYDLFGVSALLSLAMLYDRTWAIRSRLEPLRRWIFLLRAWAYHRPLLRALVIGFYLAAMLVLLGIATGYLIVP